jgi:hypothetical protein
LIVVVTAAFGGGLELLEPGFVAPDVQYVAYTDDPELRSRWWQVKLVPPDLRATPRLQAKRYKVLTHELFPYAEQSLWVDSTFSLAVDPRYLVDASLKNTDVALFSHPWRDCIYDEAAACFADGLDLPERIHGQMERYRAEAYPARNGLAACGILLRRHTPAIAELNRTWWAEIVRHSVRDQLSFDYVCWRLGVRYRTLAGDYYHNAYFRYRRQELVPEVEWLRLRASA